MVLLLGPGASASNVPEAYITPSDCSTLSSSPLRFRLASLHSFFPSLLDLYLLFWILEMSLSNRKCSHRGVLSRPRRRDTEASEIAPSLKQLRHMRSQHRLSQETLPWDKTSTQVNAETRWHFVYIQAHTFQGVFGFPIVHISVSKVVQWPQE